MARGGGNADYNMSGNVPMDAALGSIRNELLEEPRKRQWVVGQLVNGDTKIHHPDDGDDEPTPILAWKSMTAITDKADLDQLAAMEARSRLNQPGQHSLDETAQAEADDLAARRGGGRQ